MIFFVVHFAVQTRRTCGQTAGTYDLNTVVLRLQCHIKHILLEVAIAHTGQHNAVEFGVDKRENGQG